MVMARQIRFALLFFLGLLVGCQKAEVRLSAHDLVAKAAEAIGGLDAVYAHKRGYVEAAVTKKTATPVTSTVKMWYWYDDERIRIEMTSQTGQPVVLVATKDAGWMSVGSRPAIALPASAAQTARDALWRARLWPHALDANAKLDLAAPETIEGKTYDAVVVSRPDGSTATKLAFDPSNHLVVQASFTNAKGETVRELPSDYKKVGNVLMAQRLLRQVKGSPDEDTVVVQILFDDDVPPTTFDKP